jgi:hypothetical protein
MKLALVQSAGDNYQNITDICLPNHQQYAKKHGYDCLFKIDNNNLLSGRFIYALQVLAQYDAVCVVDMDLLFMNLSVQLEDKLGNFDLVSGQDINGLNSSVVIIRNSKWSFDFWNNYFNHYWAYTSCGEQTTLAYHLCAADKSKWTILPPRNLFSYLSKRLYNRDYLSEEYQHGDFAITTPGISLEDRATVLSEYVEKVIT